MDWKFVALLIGIGGGILGGASSWVALGLPTIATRGYVDNALRPVIYQQLKVRRHVNAVDLYQWQQNPPPWSQGVREKVDELKASIRDLDRRITEMER